MTDLPVLALPVGDPAGIGPEVVLKALADSPGETGPIAQKARVKVVGDRALLEQTYRHLRDRSAEPLADPADLDLLDVPLPADRRTAIAWGRESAAAGAASFAFLDAAIAEALAGRCQGIVTAPIAKSAWAAAGHRYPGQTEVLAERAGRDRFGMMFAGRSPHTGWVLRVMLATTHVPLREVPALATPSLLARKLDLLVESLQTDFAIARPRIAIAGLNPHSGERGQLGLEERDALQPWLDRERDRRPDLRLDGLVPPDTLWVQPGQAWFGRFDPARNAAAGTPTAPDLPDAYLALYHDQGLIPVKLMAFDRAVNLTVGLPFVRTSPDHGTAFDIAGRGIARPDSTRAALDWAVELTANRATARSVSPAEPMATSS